MPAIITNKMRIESSDALEENITRLPIYVYFGQTTEWDNESLPGDTIDSTQGRISALKEVEGMKRIEQENVVSVLPRIDWTPNTVYDQYTDKANIIDDKNPETNNFYKFYVVTDEFNVYKCLSNNYRSESTIKPSGSQITPFVTPDGYKWKYMYTIRTNDAFTFMTPNWVPCYTPYVNDSSAQWNTQLSAIPGTIDHIEVTNGGENYSSSNPPTVTINGNGTGCTAEAVIDDVDGIITSIEITNEGQGYTEASVLIAGGDGAGVEVEAYISPIKGHGSDARMELGATFKMFRVVLDGSEGGVLPTDITYRRTGIISEPLSNDSGLEIYVSDISMYSPNDQITGLSSGSTAQVRSINTAKRVLYVDNVVGEFIQNESINNGITDTEIERVQETNNLPFYLPVISGSSYVPYSGDLLYFSTRELITRSNNQIEELRLVLAF